MKPKQLNSLVAGDIIVSVDKAYVIKSVDTNEYESGVLIALYELPYHVRRTKKNLTSPKIAQNKYFDKVLVRYAHAWKFHLKRYYNPTVALCEV